MRIKIVTFFLAAAFGTWKVFFSWPHVGLGGGLHCRFHPTCSVYAAQAVMHFGIMHGGLLALKRVFHCRPGAVQYGYDPIPNPEPLTPN